MYKLGQSKVLKIPAVIIWIIVVMCLVPLILNLLGVHIFHHSNALTPETLIRLNPEKLRDAIYADMAGSFIHTILEWTAFNITLITFVIAVIHYRMVKDIAIPVICLALFFSGILDAFHSLAVDRLISSSAPSNELISFAWSIARTFNATILVICLSLFTFKRIPLRKVPVSAFVGMTALLTLIAIILIYYMSNKATLPTAQLPHLFIHRPYDVLPLAFYILLLVFLCPRFYKMYPGPFAQALVLMAFVSTYTEIYIIFTPSDISDGFFDMAHILKLIAYVLPLIGLLVDYVQTYRSVHTTQVQLAEQTQELTQLAHHDFLTGLHNRASFEIALEQEIARASRFNLHFALLFIDLDNFKKINDDLGHNIGDVYLQEVAARLKQCVRETDIIARIGGDEFALILEGIEHKRQAGIVASKIFAEFDKEYRIGNRQVLISGSIGIACFPESGNTVTQLCKHADIAMYRAKEHGKRQWQYFTTELDERFSKLIKLENALASALENEEFYLEYQPKFNIVDNLIIGAEVLLRWKNPELGQISPEQFVPVAEEIGLISSIGSWVLEKACQHFKEWKLINRENHLGFDLAVNISTRQLVDNSFMQTLKKLIAQYKFNPHYITIELTETAIMSKSHMLENLHEIADLGVKIAIDDFGTGYSSLSYLRKLPIQIVKIDKSFLDGLLQDQNAEKIVKSIIAMVKNLDFEIVAEGVEHGGQKEFLINNGCHIAQGFYLAKPMSAADFTALLKQQKNK